MKLYLISMVLALALLLFGTLVGLTTKDLRMTMELTSSEQAYYLAEAGLVRAEQQYALDSTWRGTWAAVPFGEGTYSVRIYDQAGTVQVESTGVVGKAKVKKVARLQ
jgi:hypothetical protein